MSFRNLIEGKIEESKEVFDLNEVAFNSGNMQKAVKLYVKILGKRLGGDFVKLSEEQFKRTSGKGVGIRYMNNRGVQVRFNWEKKTKNEFTSLDYWDSSNTDFQKPTRTVRLKKELNVVQVFDKIVSALTTGAIKESEELIDNLNLQLSETLFEARTKEEKEEWLVNNGLAKSFAKSGKVMAQKAKEAGLGEALEVFLGQSETNTFEGEIKKVEKQFDNQVYADPDTVFQDIEDLTELVGSGAWRTLIVCGMGGVGKTYHTVEKLSNILGAEGEKWTYHSGTKAAPFSFYKTLFQERDKIIVFDEADSLLKNKDIIMMLKPILDTSGDNMAEYMSGTQNMVGQSKGQIEDYSNYVDSEIAGGKNIGPGKNDVKLPSKFAFTGGMIFISNMKASEIEQAIMSRSIFVDVYLAEQDVLKRIQTIARLQAKNDPNTTDQDVDDIMEALGGHSVGTEHNITYMTPEYARKSKQITVRAYTLANTMRKAGLKRWMELAALYA